MVTLPLLMVNIAVVSGFSFNFCLWLNPDFVGEIIFFDGDVIISSG